MSRTVVITFKADTNVDQMRRSLARLRRQQLVSLAEPVVFVREPGGRLRIKRTMGLAAALALLGAFWGVMVGLLFATPWLGLGLGAAAGTVVGVAASVSTQGRSLKEMIDTLQPGQSALLLLAHDWADDRALEQEVTRFEGTILRTSTGAKCGSTLWPVVDAGVRSPRP